VSQRACFLCAENIPAEERGIRFGDLVILPNPHPILPRHLTIPVREHHPQRLVGRVENLLDLAKAVGPDMLVLYNGARCGASAPDHFHFQACSALGVPLLEETTEIVQKDALLHLSGFGRRILICCDRRADKTRYYIDRILEVLSSFQGDDHEPLINIIVVYRNERYCVFVFPRAKHRPECYFAEGNSRISVSPAALELAGVIVVAEEEHFDRVDEETAFSIYQEVSLEEDRFAKLVETVT
jgi:ATP adenylyltransferase/5',5'''-P-1,P-4-tetraphosphate phosphorylase II